MNTKKNNSFYLGEEKKKMNSFVEKLGQEHIKCLGCNKGKKLVLIVFWGDIRAPCKYFSISFLSYITNNLIFNRKVYDMIKIRLKDYLRTVIVALDTLGGSAHLNDIYLEIERRFNLVLTPGQKAGFRSVLQNCSSDTVSYLGRLDVFHRVGNGIWELRKSSQW